VRSQPRKGLRAFGRGGFTWRWGSAFRRKLAPFLDHARKAGRGQRRRPGRTAASRDRSGSIRAWAKQAGVAVSARGRIPASVVEQYQAVATKGH